MFYQVFDNTGTKVGPVFKTYHDAVTYKIVNNRLDWSIEFVDSQSTAKQQKAVRFCELVLNIPFKGNINSFIQCSNFLALYLKEAKNLTMYR